MKKSPMIVTLTTLFALGLAFYARAQSPSKQQNNEVQQTDLFVRGQDNAACYRIPSLTVTKQGTLLAFCEARRNNCSDTGDIDLVLRRSTDGGKTFGEIQVVWDDGPNTCGNPCPVVDQDTGIIWLLMTQNAGDIHERATAPGFGPDSRRAFVTHSTDDGKTWTTPQDITSAVKQASWTWYATGPGAGIQLARGEHRGRLVVPCDHKEPVGNRIDYYSHVVYSDDHGKTWQLGGRTPEGNVNECEVVELVDGRLMLNMRNYDRSKHARQVAFSNDGGVTWTDQHHDAALIEPVCQASIRRYRWPQEDKPGMILFSNPASEKGRERMTLRASLDDGASWPIAKLLYPGSSAYSCLAVLDDGSIGCLYERDGYSKITFARVPATWLLNE